MVRLFVIKHHNALLTIYVCYYSICMYTNKGNHIGAQGLGASEKTPQNYYIILQGGELACFHFFKSSC